MAHILVVEDETVINDLICKNLKLVGHFCTSAFDGKEALELIEENDFDLMLLDILLLKLDGHGVFKCQNILFS